MAPVQPGVAQYENRQPNARVRLELRFCTTASGGRRLQRMGFRSPSPAQRGASQRMSTSVVKASSGSSSAAPYSGLPQLQVVRPLFVAFIFANKPLPERLFTACGAACCVSAAAFACHRGCVVVALPRPAAPGAARPGAPSAILLS